ncbi:MAG: NAD-dependent epimerase/dehydratase family protein [Planctomycetes bacterium]|nr:NAD-dependent epimerase/dehydratase family protein [Planctomycetota bacterium]
MVRENLSYYSGKRILITGANGYVATNLIKLLKDIECTIVRLDLAKEFPEISGPADVIDISGDVCDSGMLEQALEGADIVYHLAAQTSVYVAEEKPLKDLEINVLAMLNLLEVCRSNDWHPIIVFSGTVTEAGICEKMPVDETVKDNPITVYDIHKLMAENYLKYYCQQGIVQGVSLRLANVYGPGPKSSSSDRGVLNMMIRKALSGQELTVYGEGDFIRDYVYVDDVISAFLAAPGNIEQVNGKHFVIGSSDGHTIAEAIGLVADRAASKTGSRAEVKHIEPPSALSPIEGRNFVADTKRFFSATGWKARYSLVDGIDKTLEAFLKQVNK